MISLETEPGPPPIDVRELERTRREFVQDWGPRDTIELQLVERLAWLCVNIRHAERHEDQFLAARARCRTRQADRGSELEVADLGRQLFMMGRFARWTETGRPIEDRPPLAATLKLRLEATSAGCRLMLER